MTGAWHGGKGDKPRPASQPNAYGSGYDRIDWGAARAERTEPAPKPAPAADDQGARK